MLLRKPLKHRLNCCCFDYPPPLLGEIIFFFMWVLRF